MSIWGTSKEFDGNRPLGSSPESRKRRSSAIYFYWLMLALTLTLDQFSKWIIAHTMLLNESIPLAGDVLHLTYIRNAGAAFSLLADFNTPWRMALFAAVAVVAAVAMTVVAYRERRRGVGMMFPLGLVSGGALGNLVDRLTTGTVVDFIQVSRGAFHFPVFNVADSAVVVGVIWLLLATFRDRPRRAPKR